MRFRLLASSQKWNNGEVERERYLAAVARGCAGVGVALRR